MIEMKAIRDKYDPHGGRAIGSREMLDIREAEYGGEMLYINKSKHHPMWPWNTAVMKVCVNIGMNILIHIIKMGKEIIHSVLQ